MTKSSKWNYLFLFVEIVSKIKVESTWTNQNMTHLDQKKKKEHD